VLIRDCYRTGIAAMERTIAEATAAGMLGQNILGSGFDLHMRVHPSAGRYNMGEQIALIAALEGARAVPRKRPPFPAQSGLWGGPQRRTMSRRSRWCPISSPGARKGSGPFRKPKKAGKNCTACRAASTAPI